MIHGELIVDNFTDAGKDNSTNELITRLRVGLTRF